jgi:hypothetical protein
MVHGYKAFEKDWTCLDKQYTCPGLFEEEGKLEICRNGIHFCRNLIDCFNYYPFSDCRVAEVIAHGDVIDSIDRSKSCTNKLEIIREIPMEKIIKMANIGTKCLGYGNIGSSNNGIHNSGHNNYGIGNAGSYNSGSCNAGSYNIGDFNTGNDNIGIRNTGDGNHGNWNSGNYNIGHVNTGDWNKSDYSAGCFNTEKQYIYLFNKLSNWTMEDWLRSRARCVLNSMNGITNESFINIVPYERMTPDEIAKHPESEVTGFFLEVNYRGNCERQEWWNCLDEEDKEEVMLIPNFDPEIFKEITGINTIFDFERRKRDVNK